MRKNGVFSWASLGFLPFFLVTLGVVQVKLGSSSSGTVGILLDPSWIRLLIPARPARPRCLGVASF